MPVLIEIPLDSIRIGTGSGFIYKNINNDIYLITAKHVIFDRKGIIKGDLATLYIPASDVTDTAQTIAQIDLKYLDSASVILTHNIADIAIVRMGTITDTKFRLDCGKFLQQVQSSISCRPSSMFMQYSDVTLGNDVYVYGYPTSIGMPNWSQYDSRRPLLRKGIVAGKYDPRKTIIIDCSVYGGNSGGPVVQASPLSSGQTKFKIIGVVTEFIPFDESKVNPIPRGLFSTNSGYGVVESTDRILEILGENK